jgi:hypothetical protein
VYKIVVLKNIKIYIKKLQHISVLSPSSESALFELAKVTVVKTVNENTLCGCSHTTKLTTPMYFH